jgi:hypothetical protein
MQRFHARWSIVAVLALLGGLLSASAAARAPGSQTLFGISAGVPARNIFSANLNSAQEVPTNASTATGFGIVALSKDESTITVSLTFSGLSSNQTAAHIHGSAAPGQNAGILFNIGSQGATSGTFTALEFPVTPAQVADLRAGLWYFNVHSVTYPGGEIRGQIEIACGYTAQLSGAQEVPAVPSTATGRGVVVLSADATRMYVNLSFEGLGSNQTAAHIHGPAPRGQNAGVLFNIGSQGATSGEFNGLLFNPTLTQVGYLRSGQLYFNVHSTTYGGGEIRGQIMPGCTTWMPLILK